MSGIIFTGIFVCTLILNQNHTAMAQQEPNGTSFHMNNMTFTHLQLLLMAFNCTMLLEGMVIQ